MKEPDTKAKAAQAETPRRQFEKLHQFPDRSLRALLQNETNVTALLEMIVPDLAVQMDFQSLLPAERSLLSETLREREADLLYRVPFRTEKGTREVLIYILIEHQSTIDELMAYRLLNYMDLVWERHRSIWNRRKTPKAERKFPPILPIIFYTGDTPWKTPVDFADLVDLPEALKSFVPRFEILFFGVKQIATEALTEKDHPFGWLLALLQKENADANETRAVLSEAVSHLRSLQETDPTQWKEVLSYILQLVLHKRSAEEHTTLIELIAERSQDTEVTPMAESMAEIIHQQGLEQGQIRAKREAIFMFLQHRFTRIPEPLRNTINATENIAELNTLFESALAAQTLDDIDAFVEKISPL